MNPANEIKKAKELNIEPLLQLMEAQNDLNHQQFLRIKELHNKILVLLGNERRMMIVMVALSCAVLFSILFNLL